jgi:tetratricopeptide (TPR) repeat protein
MKIGPTILTGTLLLAVLQLAGPGPLVACPAQDKSPAEPEVISLLGQKLYARPATGEALAKLEGSLREAAGKYEASPTDPETIITYGRSLAALWRYHEAIDVFTKGIKARPDYAMLYRHRGHRYITVRDFDKAVVDLAKAAELNGHDYEIWYHLGLAHYLRGDFAKALAAYRNCLEAAQKPDSKIAVSNWLYITLRRLGRKADADRLLEGITEGMEAGESKSYLSLLLFYKGVKKQSDLEAGAAASDLDLATIGYGLACWHLYSGDREKAVAYFRKIVALPYWPAFGFIASENELHAMGEKASSE